MENVHPITGETVHELDLSFLLELEAQLSALETDGIHKYPDNEIRKLKQKIRMISRKIQKKNYNLQ